jgi:hypothetical protein
METTQTTKTEGKFAAFLKRNNAKIREDRATAIVDTAQLIYKRSVEDMQVTLKQLRMEQENLLDLSPTNADSLVLASDFKADVYVAKDIELGLKIRNLEIKLEIAQKRYAYLFGGAV